ncbi:hypothetical protein AVEN_58213-1 [Araneus ventricosus]|uniref:Uncharacterized protein n=1 Tax=Araneus ventricosus TaxID=182803 RepID=A0A4Y2UIR7_ARAVE|nr:hypothetical protein AVEN_58213-1 [Araneus ventricosus]
MPLNRRCPNSDEVQGNTAIKIGNSVRLFQTKLFCKQMQDFPHIPCSFLYTKEACSNGQRLVVRCLKFVLPPISGAHRLVVSREVLRWLDRPGEMSVSDRTSKGCELTIGYLSQCCNRKISSAASL